jgi:selenoprotein W-related protein
VRDQGAEPGTGKPQTGREIIKLKMPYPRVEILFCTKCKWNLRAAWYLQELLQTFGSQLGEVALVPAESGVFCVNIDDGEQAVRVWDRVADGGFPDSKVLKQRVRDVISPDAQLGHVDKHENKNNGVLITECKNEDSGCKECEEAAAA